MNSDPSSLSLSWLDELEKRLLASGAVAAASSSPDVLPAAAVPAPPPPPHPNRAIGDVAVAVRMVLPSLGSPFGIGEVKKQLAAQHFREFGDSTIRSTLQDLKESGEILLTQRGIGRGGNRYALPPAATTLSLPAAS